MKLHYGSGLCEAPGWYNCDSSPTLWLQRLPVLGAGFRKWLAPRFPLGIQYGDIVKGLSLPPDSCDAIYCCHVLEHLSLEDCGSALRNTNLYLKPGGTFRCVLPDFEQQVAAYLADSSSAAAPEFLSYTFLGRKARPRTLTAIVRDYFGNSHHLWMWDYKALAAELEAAGFRDIRRCELGDSRNVALRTVENPGRLEGALAIECTK
jgi:predicted SAM-dependent methyltransferase